MSLRSDLDNFFESVERGSKLFPSTRKRKEIDVWIDPDSDIILQIDEEIAILSITEARELGNILLDKSIEALEN
ncbi:hypothetical protein AUF17_03965 [Enterococcus avium]|uniref:Uncharacterized protein n=1 Tax=Enterococcus avium TaxID=33945 RepID=A0A8B5W1V5_ENTAV|nr:hypothetical protein [Enterococcus avium]TRZ33277.1 hypothetical protein AUF17_03965 [Enterococcus avium]